MFRRAALGATVLLLLSAASASAAGKTVNVVNYAYKPAATTINMCDTVAWHNKSGKKHVIVSDMNFLPPNAVVAAGATSAPLAFTQAGTFGYHDQARPSMKGSIKVSPTVTPENGTTADKYAVTVACAATPGQFTHDIQVRVNSGPWQVRAGTSAQVFNFVAVSAGVWEIQTRMRYLLSGAKSGWSPSVTIAVN